MEKNKAIYIRTSTTEQTPELQLKDIYSTFPESRDAKIYQEQVSAYKDNVRRPVFEEVISLIESGGITDLYVWDWDRLYRNYKKLNQFFALCKRNGTRGTVKVHSYGQLMFEQFVNLPEPFDTMLTDMMQTLTGFLGQSESKKKSDRIKMAVVKDQGEKTRSYKGNDWGRKADLTEDDVKKMLEMRKKGRTLRQISQEFTRYDSAKNKLVTIAPKTVYQRIKQFEK